MRVGRSSCVLAVARMALCLVKRPLGLPVRLDRLLVGVVRTSPKHLTSLVPKYPKDAPGIPSLGETVPGQKREV